jgi:hypothetical protein
MSKKPDVEWDDLHASVDFRELFRYKRGGKIQVYSLRVLPVDFAEVWIVSDYRGNPAGSEKAWTFKAPDEAMKFLKGAEKRLKVEGWIQA